MTTEQMDWLDDERAGRHTTADRLKALAEKGPVFLYGTPTQKQLDLARREAAGRGVLVLPEEMRDSVIPDSLLPDDLRTTTEKEADENAKQARIAAEDGVVDITRHSEDTLFKVAQALRETGHTEADASNTITAILNAGILFREPAPDYDAVPADSDETTMAEEPIEQRLRRAFVNGWREGFDRGSWGDQRWDR